MAPESFKWKKVAPWLLLLGCWLLTAGILQRATRFACEEELLRLGPEKIVGTGAVVYEEAPGYLYTNPMAMIRQHGRFQACHLGIALAAASFATGVAWLVLRARGVRAKIVFALLGGVMLLLLLYLVIVCVWEWSLAWLALLLCARFLPRWSLKARFTAMAWIAALVLLGWRRKDLEWTVRQCDAFWNSALQCVTARSFIEAYGDPAFICRHLSPEDEEWLHSLAPIHVAVPLAGKDLYGFIPPQRPAVLLLPCFDDEGHRIAFAWCDLTPERLAALEERRSTGTRD